ncbi:MAG: hypothetical protein ACREPL_04280 [Rhodanobacteraceae bacterium]
MLLKSSDNHDGELADLERMCKLLSGEAGKRGARELRQRKAGLKGECDAAYLIDFDFAKRKNGIVVHDRGARSPGRGR